MCIVLEIYAHDSITPNLCTRFSNLWEKLLLCGIINYLIIANTPKICLGRRSTKCLPFSIIHFNTVDDKAIYQICSPSIAKRDIHCMVRRIPCGRLRQETVVDAEQSKAGATITVNKTSAVPFFSLHHSSAYSYFLFSRTSLRRCGKLRNATSKQIIALVGYRASKLR